MGANPKRIVGGGGGGGTHIFFRTAAMPILTSTCDSDKYAPFVSVRKKRNGVPWIVLVHGENDIFYFCFVNAEFYRVV